MSCRPTAGTRDGCCSAATPTATLHDELWPLAAETSFGRRRIYDARLALSLRRQGIASFATANVKDFSGFGFDRVWNPVA